MENLEQSMPSLHGNEVAFNHELPTPPPLNYQVGQVRQQSSEYLGGNFFSDNMQFENSANYNQQLALDDMINSIRTQQQAQQQLPQPGQRGMSAQPMPQQSPLDLSAMSGMAGHHGLTPIPNFLNTPGLTPGGSGIPTLGRQQQSNTPMYSQHTPIKTEQQQLQQQQQQQQVQQQLYNMMGMPQNLANVNMGQQGVSKMQSVGQFPAGMTGQVAVSGMSQPHTVNNGAVQQTGTSISNCKLLVTHQLIHWIGKANDSDDGKETKEYWLQKGKVFNVKVGVFDSEGVSLGDSDPGLELEANLVYDNDERKAVDDIKQSVMTGERKVKTVGGTAQFKLKMQVNSSQRDEQKFRVEIKPIDPMLMKNLDLHAFSEPVRVIAKLTKAKALKAETQNEAGAASNSGAVGESSTGSGQSPSGAGGLAAAQQQPRGGSAPAQQQQQPGQSAPPPSGPNPGQFGQQQSIPPPTSASTPIGGAAGGATMGWKDHYKEQLQQLSAKLTTTVEQMRHMESKLTSEEAGRADLEEENRKLREEVKKLRQRS